MRAGRLDRRIVIQQTSQGIDSHGDTTNSWSTLATVWAEIVPLRGDERMQSQQTAAMADYRFRIRYRSDVTPKMRIKIGSDYYDITAVSEIGRKKGTEMMARRVVS